MVDDPSGEGEGAASALGVVRVHDVLDKCVELANWVGFVVVAFVVPDWSIHSLKGGSGVVGLEGGNQRSNLSDKLVLCDACLFCLHLVFDLVQGLALLIASGTLSTVNLLACFDEIRIQVLHFFLKVSDSMSLESQFVILESEFRVLGGNGSILLCDGVLQRLDIGSQFVDCNWDVLEESRHSGSKVGSAFSNRFKLIEDIIIVDIFTHGFVVWHKAVERDVVAWCARLICGMRNDRKFFVVSCQF